jgi:hypothetical protein
LTVWTNNTQQMQIGTDGNVAITGNIYQNGNLVPNLVTMLTYNLAF